MLGGEPFDEAAFDRQEAKIISCAPKMTKQFSQSVKLAIKDLSRKNGADLPKCCAARRRPAN